MTPSLYLFFTIKKKEVMWISLFNLNLEISWAKMVTSVKKANLLEFLFTYFKGHYRILLSFIVILLRKFKFCLNFP